MTLQSSATQQARLSAMTPAAEGRCLNVMDAPAHALQALHRHRYAHISVAPMFQAYSATPKPFTSVPAHAY